ncbi:phage tail tip lysozyme [Kribbella sp. NBC_00662]|uniref:phage tail tip lysozyme n=1 Tax=Kribbella sp. NBC_00662 TaxID=2975969 RepID=UPI00325304A0
MGDSKVLPILGAIGLILLLPLLIVLLMLLGVLGGMDTAEAQCAQQATEQSLFAYPTDSQKIDVDWTEPLAVAPHQGYDFKVDEGSKVYASQDGKVVKASDGEVRIRREDVETRTTYLKTISVALNADVKRGDVIGTSGSGNEVAPGLVGPHIHWEMWVNKAEKKDDPADWETQKPDKNPFELDTSDSGDSGCTCLNGDLSGANNQQKAFNFFVQNGYTKEQAAGIVGNMISESSVEPGRKQGTAPGTVTKPADVLGYSGGWGIVQWTPASKMINPSRDAGVGDDVIGSLAYQLDFLHKQLLGKPPLSEKAAGDAVKAATSVDAAAVAFGGQFERFAGYENPNNPRYAERKANAEHVLNTFGGSAPAVGKGGDTSGCGAGSGNIAEVAKNLAWPESGHNGTDASLAKPEFVQAMAKYNDGASGQTPYSDCGRFVATVMHMSGADPKYPNVGTDVQRTYLESSGKYDWWHGEPPGGMKPGDILNGPGHTYLYVGPWGKEGGGYNAASGSLGDHVPEAGHLYGVGGQFTVYRLKSAPVPKD